MKLSWISISCLVGQYAFVLASKPSPLRPSIANILFAKRQSCPAGQGVCNTSLCCPLDGECCEKGCGPTGVVCCADATYCPSGTSCCNDGSCAPAGGQCCGNGMACEAGNICVQITGQAMAVCCVDTSCRATVQNGVTSSLIAFPTNRSPAISQLPLSTSIPAAESAGLTPYTRTIAWSYFSYYYATYSESLSSVTNTPTVTTSIVTVFASNEVQLTSSLSSISAAFSTPEAATSLASLFSGSLPGSTSTPTSTNQPSLHSGESAGIQKGIMSWKILAIVIGLGTLIYM